RSGAADSDVAAGVVTAAASYPATSDAAEPRVPKSGSFQPIKAKSTESKLYQLLLAPAGEASPADPASNWIGFDRITFADNDA
ncbi:hypothetical protein ACXWS7_09320, partial [Streptococcus pyogenes]